MESLIGRKEVFNYLSTKELEYLKNKMSDNYVRVKRINFKISESYLKDCRAIELILEDRKMRENQIRKDKINRIKKSNKRRSFV
ncbi:MAG: hypothetical protein IJ086_11560 [Clostridium sp.]|nr:hypothetical protein [Clostridium sp.]